MANNQFLQLMMDAKPLGDVSFFGVDLHGFSYHPAWRSSGFELTPAIPIDSPVDLAVVSRFFVNLLPESDALDVAARFMAISKLNLLAFLSCLGEDMPGAIELRKPGSMKTPHTRIFTPLDLDDLEKRLDAKERDLAIWNGAVRLPVAGVQDKINVMNHPALGLGFANGVWASTHILKFESPRTPCLAINELATLALAEAVGLKVNKAEIVNIGQHRALLVERFDRSFNVKLYQVDRRHVVDGCQLLDRDASQKYERPFSHGKDTKNIRDGVSFRELFATRRWAKDPDQHTLSLLDWVVFNLLVGNSDCHAKNLSFFVDEKGIELTPFYDLVNIMLFDVDHAWAMGFGDEFLENGQLPGTYDLACFSHDCDLNGDLVSHRFERQVCILKEKAPGILEGFGDLPENERNHLSRYAERLESRLEHLQMHGAGIQQAIEDLILN